jgi:hypothetical protein
LDFHVKGRESLDVSENRVVIIGDWGKLHSEEIHHLYSPDVIKISVQGG